MDFGTVLLIILLVAGICFYRKFDATIYFIAAVDIFFRILEFIASHIGVSEISKFVREYFPTSIPAVIEKYTDGVLSTILLWVYAIIFAIFLFYTIKILWKKR